MTMHWEKGVLVPLYLKSARPTKPLDDSIVYLVMKNTPCPIFQSLFKSWNWKGIHYGSGTPPFAFWSDDCFHWNMPDFHNDPGPFRTRAAGPPSNVLEQSRKGGQWLPLADWSRAWYDDGRIPCQWDNTFVIICICIYIYIPWMSKTVFGTVLRERLFLGTKDERLISEFWLASAFPRNFIR